MRKSHKCFEIKHLNNVLSCRNYGVISVIIKMNKHPSEVKPR